MTAIAFETTGPLAVITMTHEPHNLLGPDLMEPLLDALQRASSQHARAVPLKIGLRHFCAGADLALFQNPTDSATFDAVGTLRAFEEYPVPIVCTVAEIGYSDADIAALIADGALPPPPPDPAEPPSTLNLKEAVS